MSGTKLTPMLKQYHEVKRRHPGTLLFFRLGDFYEMFYDDAVLGAKELEITLTARHKEHGTPIPMCGVPYHAATGYIAKLIRKGYRVAICDQVEEKTGSKLVRREVVRVITPGTALESQLLDTGDNNYLAAIHADHDKMAAGFLDLSTGELSVTEFTGQQAWEKITEQLDAFAVREVIFPQSLESLVKARSVKYSKAADQNAEAVDRDLPLETTILDQATLTPLEDWVFNVEYCASLLHDQFAVTTLDGFGLAGHELAVCTAGAAVHYARETQKAQASHITGVAFFQPSDFMMLDPTTLRNLELTESADGSRENTLLHVINFTETAMGARLLKQWLLRPSVHLSEINTRLDAVAELKSATILRDQLRIELKRIQDLERLVARINLGTASPRDLIAVKNSLSVIPRVKDLLAESTASLLEVLAESLDSLDEIRSLIGTAIADNPPANLSDGGTIRAGYHAELDELRSMATSGKTYLANIERRERSRTGIQSLKVKFNNVFGYFIEISKANLHLAPADYERKQTLVGAERFTTPELKEYEAKILGAEERIIELETEIFQDIRRQIASATMQIQANARALAHLDVLASLAEAAARRNYCRPVLSEDDEVFIKDGRHPVVEVQLGRFVPNDLSVNNTTDRLLVITGPNMGGKSVYLRQAALICILAQIGSFVPATEAQLGVIDRIFTRVGASDSVARGRSTFMAEMIETAKILNTATPRSLVLLDEVGRGTATFDGLSIAWAVAEYLHNNANHAAKTLFATHYHEMTELEKVLPGVRNYQVMIKESRGEIVFLHKVNPGIANKSYGIEVARLAGLPRPVIERAREILDNLEANELDPMGKPKLAEHLPTRDGWKRQPSLFDVAHNTVIEELRRLDVEKLSPESAKVVLESLKKKLV
jgi:DNA mismatch repair protein MutS